jgi:poly-gamma-glutamate synthesis protein (capsule biosynthesis protein)
VTIAAVGDVMLDRDVGVRIVSEGPRVVFNAVAGLLTEADLAVANLETPISDIGTPQAKSYTFRSDPASVASLLMGGIDVVSLANNHALDYGPDALLDTVERLRAVGIETAGAGADGASAAAPAIVERNGLRIAFLSWVDTPPEGPGYSAETWSAGPLTPGVNWASLDAITAGVQAAREQSDVVIVLLHCGIEWSTVPSDLQRMYAQAAIDAGAALVIGHHPHVLQPVEEYGDGLIAYSLGNFVFDGFWGEGNVSAVLQLTLTREGVESWDMVPVDIVDGLPVPRE